MPRKNSDEDILAVARERFKLIETAEADIRKEALLDLQFCAGKQWSDADEQSRTGMGTNKRPCLVFNKLLGPLNQTANEARQNQPGIEVHPVDMTSDADTADVMEGMIRHIEYVSKANDVYETALEQSTAGSFSYFKINTRYAGPATFEQELRIERVADPFTIYVDPWCKEADKSDMRYAFEIDVIPRDDYIREYGESVITQLNFFEGAFNPAPDWVGKEGVRIAVYWCVEIKTRKLVLLQWPDGKKTPRYRDEIPEELPPGITIATDEYGDPIERETEERQVKCYKINGIEILDETDWPGQWIPLCYVGGKEMYINGKRHLFSLVRFARDPQRLYNFYRSAEAETVMLGTKAPWIGVKGSFRDPRWATANTAPWAYIEYEPEDIAGRPVPPPTRNIFEPPIQALSLGAAQASDDIKATTNVYDASLGNRSNETSGIAIRQRQSQAGLSNFHFIDNLNRAIRQCGVILCDLIPHIYDTPREVRILGEDRKQQIVKVNQQYYDENSGQVHDYNLTTGQYDVTITVGPSTTTQRQETWETLTQMAQAYPQLLQIAGDVLFQNADFPGSEKLAERFRKTLPPGMADEGPGKAPAQMLASQVQQQGQMIDQLTQALNQAQEAIRTKQIEQQGDLQSKWLEIQSSIRIEQEKIASSDRQAGLKAQTDMFNTIAKVNADLAKTDSKITSIENIELLRAQMAQIEAQIARMSSGTAAEESAAPAGTMAGVVPASTPPPME